MVKGADRQRNHPQTNARAQRLRRTPTRAEAALWKLLRTLPMFRFRRQLPLAGHVYDFGDHASRLLIEVDGGVHDAPWAAEKDGAKDAAAASLGYRVLRLANDTILREPDLALGLITRTANAAPLPTPTPPHKGEGLQGRPT